MHPDHRRIVCNYCNAFFWSTKTWACSLKQVDHDCHGGMTMCSCTCNPCWYYAPALGFLMFSVGVSSSEKDFLKAFKRPTSVLAGYTGQFLVKPLLGYVFGFIAVVIFGLPTPVGFFSTYVMPFGHFCLRYLCVGAPLAINIEPDMSSFGLTVLLLFIACYLTVFIAGYFLTGVVSHTTPDVKALQRTLSYGTGMQRSLLALANRFFQDLQSL